jgi:hypothetical protein
MKIGPGCSLTETRHIGSATGNINRPRDDSTHDKLTRDELD